MGAPEDPRALVNEALDLLGKATPGPWMPTSWDFETTDELCAEHDKALRNYTGPGSTTLYGTWVQDEERGYLFPAMTGNGPTSKANAAFVSAMPGPDGILTRLCAALEQATTHTHLDLGAGAACNSAGPVTDDIDAATCPDCMRVAVRGEEAMRERAERERDNYLKRLDEQAKAWASHCRAPLVEQRDQARAALEREVAKRERLERVLAAEQYRSGPPGWRTDIVDVDWGRDIEEWGEGSCIDVMQEDHNPPRWRWTIWRGWTEEIATGEHPTALDAMEAAEAALRGDK